jgi:hypothetical protein
MEISRIGSGMPPGARDEISQRLQNGRGGDVGGNPRNADHRAASERQAAAVQTVAAVNRTTRPDLAEPARDVAAMRPPPERGGRLDVRI